MTITLNRATSVSLSEKGPRMGRHSSLLLVTRVYKLVWHQNIYLSTVAIGSVLLSEGSGPFIVVLYIQPL